MGLLDGVGADGSAPEVFSEAAGVPERLSGDLGSDAGEGVGARPSPAGRLRAAASFSLTDIARPAATGPSGAAIGADSGASWLVVAGRLRAAASFSCNVRGREAAGVAETAAVSEPSDGEGLSEAIEGGSVGVGS
jgi:hypothetical protein